MTCIAINSMVTARLKRAQDDKVGTAAIGAPANPAPVAPPSIRSSRLRIGEQLLPPTVHPAGRIKRRWIGRVVTTLMRPKRKEPGFGLVRVSDASSCPFSSNAYSVAVHAEYDLTETCVKGTLKIASSGVEVTKWLVASLPGNHALCPSVPDKNVTPTLE